MMTNQDSHDSSASGASSQAGTSGPGVNLALLDSMDGHAFEDVVESLLRKMNFHVEGRSTAADGGIDMIAIKYDAIVGGKYIIQCKRFSGSIGNSFIRDLFGVVHSENANKGILITNSSFTREAQRFAEGKPIELIDGGKLQELLSQHGLLGHAESSAKSIFSPGFQLLYTQFALPLSRIIEESDRISENLVFLPKKDYDLNAYQGLIHKHMGQITGFLISSAANVTALAPTAKNSHPPSEDLSALRQHIRELIKMARALLNIQKEVTSISPPPEFATVHPIYLRIAPGFLRRLWNFVEPLKKVVEGDSTESEFVLNLDVYIPELEEMTNELDRLSELAEASIEIPGNRAQTKSECFIATAAYGSELHPKVFELRRFRDKVLSKYTLGRCFVRIYIRISPPIARLIERHEWLRRQTRSVLRMIMLFTALIKDSKYRI